MTFCLLKLNSCTLWINLINYSEGVLTLVVIKFKFQFDDFADHIWIITLPKCNYLHSSHISSTPSMQLCVWWHPYTTVTVLCLLIDLPNHLSPWDWFNHKQTMGIETCCLIDILMNSDSLNLVHFTFLNSDSLLVSTLIHFIFVNSGLFYFFFLLFLNWFVSFS